MKEIMIRWFHLQGLLRRISLFFINHVFRGTNPHYFGIKRTLCKYAGFQVGEGSRIVGPIHCDGTLVIGRECWIGQDFRVHGNGKVVIGNRCDIAPEVAISTGGHEIGNHIRRAGAGHSYEVDIGDGCWIGLRATIVGPAVICQGTVVAACACVVHEIPAQTLVGGVPARVIKNLE